MITTEEYLALEVGDTFIDKDEDICVVLQVAEFDWIEFDEYNDSIHINDLSGEHGGGLEECISEWVSVTVEEDLNTEIYGEWTVLPVDIIKLVSHKHFYDHTKWFEIWGAPDRRKLKKL